ncbi:toxin [Escherichia coli]|nr:toxin [Escherichia coli]PBU10167.1 toxin [Escherichia coli]
MSELYSLNFLYNENTAERLLVNNSEIERFSCLEGDLLFGRTSLTLEGVGDCLLVKNVTDIPVFESNLFRLRFDRNKASPLFFYYFFKSKSGRSIVQRIAKQTAATSITATDLIQEDVPCLSLKSQMEIAEKIHVFDKKIMLNNKINQTLEQIAQALFKSWFVDFDPVVDNALDAGFFEQDLEFSDELMRRAETRKSVRENADFKPLPENIRQLFPAAFEECSEPSLGLDGWVPEGWLETKLSELVDTVSKTYPLKTVDEVIFLNTGDIENGNFLHANYSKVDGLPGQAKKSIQKGDILFSEIRPKNKRFAYVGFESKNYVVSTKLMVLRAKDGFHPLFAYFLLTLNHTTDELQRIAELRSGTFPQITFSELSLIKFVLPSTGRIMERFVSLYLEPFFEKTSSNRQENESLVNLRDTLLPKLISGEIKLNENEAGIANVVFL